MPRPESFVPPGPPKWLNDLLGRLEIVALRVDYFFFPIPDRPTPKRNPTIAKRSPADVLCNFYPGVRSQGVPTANKQ